MRLAEAIDHFLRQLRANGRAERTVEAYHRALDKLRRTLGDRDVRELTADDVARFVLGAAVQAKADGGPKAAITVNQARTAVRMLFGYLVEAGVLERSPAATLKMAQASSPQREVLDVHAQQRLLAAMAAFDEPAARRDLVMFSVFLGTGLRLSSLVALDVADVDLRRGRLEVTVKGGRRESVVLSKPLLELLAGWVESRRTGPLFVSCRGSRISTRQVQQRLGYWLDVAGLDAGVTVHGLRHTFGTRLYEATGDLRVVAAALHHRNLCSTERYARVGEARLRAAVEAVA